jgi:cell division protein ZapA
MGQIAVTLNGRTYRLRCGDGEEDRLVVLATQVKAKFDELLAQHGNAGEDRLLLMTALLLADELQDARSALEKGGDVARSGDGGKPSRKGAA